MKPIAYPTETLQEIITNAVIHRDYSIGDDVQIRIFDNRVEVESPGRFPANVNAENCRETRFLRNGALVRYLSMFPSKHNKDLGEGLDTAFQAMSDVGLKEPIIEQRDNSVLVVIPRLASPEVRIMEYLEVNAAIKNSEARALLNEPSEYRVRAAFQRLLKENLIEKVPGTATSSAAYRKKKR
jgi:ATP-dependent DNA helicase RecG